MKKLLLLSLFTLLSCKKADSQQLKNFSSYSEAISKVKSSSFTTEETTPTEGRSQNDWITSASYRTNDRQNGFLIIGMKGKEYIFDEVPQTIWEDFKKANDLGDFYNANIKNRYTLTLNKQSTTDTQCKGTTKKGKRCKRNATNNGYCFQHS